MKIGEVAERAGLRPSAIRWYESVGLLPAPVRRSGRRVYEVSVLERLAVVRLAQQAGFSLAEVRTLLHGFSRNTPPPARWRSLAWRKLDEVRTTRARLEEMEAVLGALLGCACPTLEDCGRALAGRSPRPPTTSRRRRGPSRGQD